MPNSSMLHERVDYTLVFQLVRRRKQNNVNGYSQWISMSSVVATFVRTWTLGASVHVLTNVATEYRSRRWARAWERAFICFILLLLSSVTAFGNETSSLTKQDLFIGVENGFAKYRIPGIEVTAKGSVLAYCEARRTGPESPRPLCLPHARAF